MLGEKARLDAISSGEGQMREREFFRSENVYVGLTRFVAFGQTYAMSGVTSVRAAEIKPSRAGVLFVGGIGLISVVVGCYGSGGALFLGVALLVLAALIALAQKSEYYVCLTVSSGEVRAVKSHDWNYIAAVVQALNDCIVARG